MCKGSAQANRESGRGTRSARGVSTEGQQGDKGTECARAYWNKHMEMSVHRDKCARGISAPGEQISKRSKHGRGACVQCAWRAGVQREGVSTGEQGTSVQGEGVWNERVWKGSKCRVK